MTATQSSLDLKQQNSTNTLPVGGLDPENFDYKEVWYPLFLSVI